LGRLRVLSGQEVCQILEQHGFLSSNHFIQQFFDPMTVYTGPAKYILGEFGIGFTLVVAVLAVYFWMRRADVAQPR
jgi:hypothetical protein